MGDTKHKHVVLQNEQRAPDADPHPVLLETGQFLHIALPSLGIAPELSLDGVAVASRHLAQRLFGDGMNDDLHHEIRFSVFATYVETQISASLAIGTGSITVAPATDKLCPKRSRAAGILASDRRRSDQPRRSAAAQGALR
ncbi:hypothetical protein GTW51_08205 [Aurantimonas aggregata]|uniref:Uncharacterized protein n=1 Tax=Aurantimonas aggregata TaxID=2047720 RepID=A0A6L9MGE8_9HYPH|nr:DUF1841 family protein [Aurantimonas aggregata]NDV86682.1 hypothetical protein [Aurantimonas aggregata]